MRLAKRKTTRHRKVMVVKRTMTKNTRDSASQTSVNPKTGDDSEDGRSRSKGSEVINTCRLTSMPWVQLEADSPPQLSPLIHGGDTAHGIKWKRGQWS
jgi:hypothetical protein